MVERRTSLAARRRAPCARRRACRRSSPGSRARTAGESRRCESPATGGRSRGDSRPRQRRRWRTKLLRSPWPAASVLVHLADDWVTAAGAPAPHKTNAAAATTMAAGNARLDALVPRLRAADPSETCGRAPSIGRKKRMNAQVRHEDLVSRNARLAFERVVAATARAAPSRAQLARTPPAARAGRPGRARPRGGRRPCRHRRRRADRPRGAAPPPRLAAALPRRRAARVRRLRADGARHGQGRQRAEPQLRALAADGGRRLRRLRGHAHDRRLRGRLLGAAQRRRGPRRGGRARARPRSARVRDPCPRGPLLRDRDPRERRRMCR